MGNFIICILSTLAATLSTAMRLPDDPSATTEQYWSYQPIIRPAIPTLARRADSSTSRPLENPIDFFIAARLAEDSLELSPPADPAVWLRRVYIDLIGVPPTREQLHRFLANPSESEYRRVVEELLESPMYGQRWGRHWMDVWRYSDWYGSRGINEIRYSQRHIWRWRDWIIDGLNADTGYDQMILQMLAGDELAPADPNVTRATGFIGRNWYKFDRNVWMFDAVEHTAQAFLGMTLRCARCHDHKYDPITQQDYYRLRAFFEPHDVRTDPISRIDTEKDATLGQVLNDGVARVYDKQLDVPTFLFTRGDNRYPDENQRMEPGVPGAFRLTIPPIQPVPLPADAIAPWLRADVVRRMLDQSQAAIADADALIENANSAMILAERRLADWIDREASGLKPPARDMGKIFTDRFERPRPDSWRNVSGEWTYRAGHLEQTQPGSFCTMVSSVEHPQDFAARVRYKTTQAGTIHSVGVFFDSVDLRDCQGVYTAAGDKKSTVQAFHRQGGVEQYPASGIVPYPIRVGQLVTIDLAVRGQQLNVWVDGHLAIAYTMPLARHTGTFALWTHAGSAEFYELLVDSLPSEFQIATSATEQTRSPYDDQTRHGAELSLKLAQRGRIAADAKRTVAQLEFASLEARIAADRAKVLGGDDVEPAAIRAASAVRSAKLARADYELLVAENAEFSARNAGTDTAPAGATAPAGDTTDIRAKASADVAAKVAAARNNRDAARSELAKQDSNYTAIGPIYPNTSTGRRLALARWIANADNPRTARVAVNHIWLRHFGQAIVPTVANFGLNGSPPSHPQLLDWLAAEFIESGWSMKHMHRLMVLSHTYRQTSATVERPVAATAATPAGPNTATQTSPDGSSIDPENRLLWRMNPRRMESEVVRDSILSISGQLDTTFGGVEIPESMGQESVRRSVYFRSTPNEKMALLEVFDQANPNECYRRHESVMPQQSLALSNSALCVNQSRTTARLLSSEIAADSAAPDSEFVTAAFERILSRPPTAAERNACERFLVRDAALIRDGIATKPFAVSAGPAAIAPSDDPRMRARENLVHVLFNHNDFVTVR